jgi:hypothetical protein
MIAGAIVGGISGGVGAALQGGDWKQIGVGVGVGAIGGAAIGFLPGAALLQGLGVQGQAILRGLSGALGNVNGQYLAGYWQGGGAIDPCSFQFNKAALAGAAVGGAEFGTLGSVATVSVSTMMPMGTLMATSGTTIQGATALGVASRVAIAAPFAVAQGSTTAGFGILGAPTLPACSCRP